MDWLLIEHCAPTLAGFKTASLFSYAFGCREELERCLRESNAALACKGISLEALRIGPQRALVYVYRPARLRADLAQAPAAQLLRPMGYDPDNAAACLGLLRLRLCQNPGFPHEIGLFLGYPPADVAGFLAHGGRNCKCCGCWKVYDDESAARRLFDVYHKCRCAYAKRFSLGATVAQLTVAV